MNPNKRTAKEWQEAIQRELPSEWWPKVACIVWWNYCHKPQWKTSDWFREKINGYEKERDEMEFDVLEYALRKIGVSEYLVKKACTKNVYDLEREQKKQRSKKNEK